LCCGLLSLTSCAVSKELTASILKTQNIYSTQNAKYHNTSSPERIISENEKCHRLTFDFIELTASDDVDSKKNSQIHDEGSPVSKSVQSMLGFVVNKLTLGHVLSRVFQSFPASVISPSEVKKMSSNKG
jgi:hypothetical protein